MNFLDLCTHTIEQRVVGTTVIANGRHKGTVVSVNLNHVYPVKVRLEWMDKDEEPYEYTFSQVEFQ